MTIGNLNLWQSLFHDNPFEVLIPRGDWPYMYDHTGDWPGGPAFTSPAPPCHPRATRLGSQVLQGSPHLTKSQQIWSNLTKSHQRWSNLTKVLRFTKEGWRVDQLEPRLVGMLNVARLQVCLSFFKPNFVPAHFFCFPIQFGLVKPAPVQFSWVQVLKQRGEEEETCTAEVAPFNFFIILIHYHFLNLCCSHYYYHHYDQVAPFNCQQLVQDRFKLIHIVHKGTTRWLFHVFHAGSTDCLFEEWLFVSGENVGWRMQVVPSFCHLGRWDRARLTKRRKRGNIPLIAI